MVHKVCDRTNGEKVGRDSPSGPGSHQVARVRLETEHPLDVYADGEFVCQTPVEFSVARDALKVIVPGVAR